MHIRASPFGVLLDIIQRPDIRGQEASDEDVGYGPTSSGCIGELILLLHLPSPPRLSGFLKLKASTTFSLRAWKERWLVMTQYNDQTSIHVYRKRKECYSKTIFTVCTQHCVAVEPSLCGPGLFCFSFAIVEGGRIILAATSAFQMWSWISCIQSSQLD